MEDQVRGREGCEHTRKCGVEVGVGLRVVEVGVGFEGGGHRKGEGDSASRAAENARVHLARARRRALVRSGSLNALRS